MSTFDTANGPGVRVSLFCSGCTLRCKGCFNKESWDFRAGKPFTEETLETILRGLDSDYVEGLSLLGGDPLEKENIPQIEEICRAVRRRFGNSKTIWMWTGRKLDQVAGEPVLDLIDVLVDGPFIEKFKTSGKGAWRGSTNQRIIKISALKPGVTREEKR